jgi:hypothetical protein
MGPHEDHTNLLPNKFATKMEHFQLNLDEEGCLMASADGTLHIIAGHYSKTEKRSNNLRLSLTAIRLGGSEGPWIFLYIKGKAHQYRSISDKNYASPRKA